MNITGEKASCSDERVVIGVFDVELTNVPVVLVFVTIHRKHLRHSVIDTSETTITTRVCVVITPSRLGINRVRFPILLVVS